MQRREILTGAGAGLIGAAALSAGGARAAEPAAKPGTTPATRAMPDRLPGDGKRPLPVNKPRAYEILDRLGIDGLIALRPQNVYYLTNTWPVTTQFGGEIPALATFSRDPNQPDFFIGTTGSGWEFFNGDREVCDFMPFSGVANWRDYMAADAQQLAIEPQSVSGLMNNGGFAVKPEGEFADREKVWRHVQESYNPSAAPSIEWALVKALKESGLRGKKVAVDDMRIAFMLQTIGFEDITILPYGDNVFLEIRMIKQAHEIELMRKAQLASQWAARAAAHSLEPGMTYEDARIRFAAEAARHGAEVAFLLLGVTQGLLPDGVVREGRSYMIDCGAYYRHYMGDFARTVSIGEPSAALKTRFKAQQIGRAAAYEKIKPGVKFSEIQTTAREAMVKAGMPSDVVAACLLHSVGLQHGDQPYRSDTMPYHIGGDWVLEKGMAVTLDLPFLEIGWGAGHNEDLLLITDNGYELMNSADEPLIVV